jgi:hypothetical protein
MNDPIKPPQGISAAVQGVKPEQIKNYTATVTFAIQEACNLSIQALDMAGALSKVMATVGDIPLEISQITITKKTSNLIIPNLLNQ